MPLCFSRTSVRYLHRTFRFSLLIYQGLWRPTCPEARIFSPITILRGLSQRKVSSCRSIRPNFCNEVHGFSIKKGKFLLRRFPLPDKVLTLLPRASTKLRERPCVYMHTTRADRFSSSRIPRLGRIQPL